ncbi:Uma2 family endonuclease [Synechocystis sp. FACHB-383]|uniref:Uma2 family endonuclease n=1 Tax=Synechocystis sp. FACHB-383 TaxID=2692864 RepID=UPI00168756BA|nr:Uma2 family endonuclease [Synechocystis sp. FACHB-383]MBD2652493.1 Uma2 family endonuclease [Synechocystis sp. FACHB-383]
MLANAEINYQTPQEYLDWEALQEFRHEYLDGQILAMTGGTIAHNLIGLNLATLLKSHLRGTGCRVFMADVKVKVALASSFHYPDVMVSCDDREQEAVQFIQFPCFIAEVLSPSTEAYDRGEKFRRYRQLPSLMEYLLVDSNKMAVDLFSRNSQGRWELISYEEGDLLSLETINWECSLASLYEDVIGGKK